MLDLPAIGRKSFKGTRLPPRRAFRPGTFPFELIKNLQDEYPELAQHAETAGLLDQYYVPTRYPNALPDGVPHEVFSHKQAEEALERLEALILQVRTFVRESNG